MEVMRILKTLDLKMDRTVRLALWGGEEEGLLGSKAYVKEHFADPAVMKPTAEHGRLSGYFNLDNGSGKIRGINLQDNDATRPIFEKWLEPFKDLGASAIALRNTGGNRSSFVRCRGSAWLPVYSGPSGLLHTHAPFEYGCVRSYPSHRSGAGLGDHCFDGL